MAQVKSLQTGIKFKDTPIGKIPVDWEVVSIEQIAKKEKFSIVDGPFGTNLKLVDYVAEGVPVLQGKNITSNRLEWSDIRYVSNKKASELSRSLIKVGDILITKIGTLGCAAIINDLHGHKTALIPANLAKISPAPETIDTRFFYHLLLWNGIKKRLIDLASRTAQPALSLRTIKLFLIILPPLSEQKKIAEILTTVDDAIEETDRIIEKTKELKKGLMQQLFTHGIGHKKFKTTEIGEIPVEWEIVELKDIAAPERYSFVDGPFGSNLKTIHYTSRGGPVIQSQMVNSGKFTPFDKFYVTPEKAKELERSKVVAGDIVIAKIGVNYGASATVPDGYPDAILSGNTMKITPDKQKIITSFLQHMLHYYREKKVFEKIVSTTAQPAITFAGVKKLRIPLPQKKEQSQIANILSNVDLKLDDETLSIVNLETLKKSLMQILLTGRVRVKLH